MQELTTPIKVLNTPFKAVAVASLVTMIFSLLSPAFMEDTQVLVTGFPLSVLLALAAIVMYRFLPTSSLTLLAVRGNALFLRSMINPMVGVGREFRPGRCIALDSLRGIEMESLYMSKVGLFVVITLLKRDGSHRSVFFKWELRDGIRGFFQELQRSHTDIGFTEGSPENRLSFARRFPGLQVVRPD